MKTTLYRMYGSSDVLLYVGITDCLERRCRQHCERSAWYREVTRLERQECLSREHAEALELVAIRFEQPRYNKARTAKVAKSHIPSVDALLSDMEAFAEMNSVKLSSIGQWAAQNRNAYERIKSGTAARKTREKIAAWLNSPPAQFVTLPTPEASA